MMKLWMKGEEREGQRMVVPETIKALRVGRMNRDLHSRFYSLSPHIPWYANKLFPRVDVVVDRQAES